MLNGKTALIECLHQGHLQVRGTDEIRIKPFCTPEPLHKGLNNLFHSRDRKVLSFPSFFCWAMKPCSLPPPAQGYPAGPSSLPAPQAQQDWIPDWIQPKSEFRLILLNAFSWLFQRQCSSQCSGLCCFLTTAWAVTGGTTSGEHEYYCSITPKLHHWWWCPRRE